jgi:uncharacterized membrane protein YfcA
MTSSGWLQPSSVSCSFLMHVLLLSILPNPAGVPLLLGSLYGSDMLQAALAAASTTAAPSSSSSSIVLADQHHDITMERFRALAGGSSLLSQMGLLLASVLPGGIAHAEVRP